MTKKGHFSLNWSEVTSTSHFWALKRPAPKRGWNYTERHVPQPRTASSEKWNECLGHYPESGVLKWIRAAWQGLLLWPQYIYRQALPWFTWRYLLGKRFTGFFYYKVAALKTTIQGFGNICWRSQLLVSAKTTAWCLVSCGPLSPFLHQDVQWRDGKQPLCLSWIMCECDHAVLKSMHPTASHSGNLRSPQGAWGSGKGVTSFSTIAPVKDCRDRKPPLLQAGYLDSMRGGSVAELSSWGAGYRPQVMMGGWMRGDMLRPIFSIAL